MQHTFKIRYRGISDRGIHSVVGTSRMVTWRPPFQAVGRNDTTRRLPTMCERTDMMRPLVACQLCSCRYLFTCLFMAVNHPIMILR